MNLPSSNLVSRHFCTSTGIIQKLLLEHSSTASFKQVDPLPLINDRLWYTLSQLFGIAWFINYWKIRWRRLKTCCISTLVRADGQGGAATLLPPRYKDDDLRLTLNTSPGPIAFIEQISGGKSPTSKHEYLFFVSEVKRVLKNKSISIRSSFNNLSFSLVR